MMIASPAAVLEVMVKANTEEAKRALEETQGVPATTLAEPYMGPDRRLVIPCGCGCSYVTIAEWVDFDDEEPTEWFLDFYESDHGASWRWRLKQMWRALLGREAVSHDVCWRPEQIAQLRDWLNEWVPK